MARAQQLLLIAPTDMSSQMRIPKVHPRLVRLRRSSFAEKDACDDLQAVCNAMLHLLQQHFLVS